MIDLSYHYKIVNSYFWLLDYTHPIRDFTDTICTIIEKHYDALLHINWLTPKEGGRTSGPPVIVANQRYSPCACFKNDSGLHSLHFYLRHYLDKLNVFEEITYVKFMDPVGVFKLLKLKENHKFKITEGNKTVAIATFVRYLKDPKPN